ncbi:MAG TPA: hypothetical protein VNO43_18060 [Candidatus Eisenbacteria bacterium]|nr:hypothetical protein [Candidatus Eisenbacteria bacterium]
MELQKINVKLFTGKPDLVPLTEFIDVFHRWIQASDGIYHDVADYSHMEAGPGIILVAGDANVSVDETGNRRGLLYNQKALLAGSNQDRLRMTLRRALEYALRLEEEPGLAGRLEFLGGELSICINDRLLAPNADASFDDSKEEFATLARDLYGDDFTLARAADPRLRLTVHIRAARPSRLGELLVRLCDHESGLLTTR